MKCVECRKCNRKGKPSAMKGSAWCESMRGFMDGNVGISRMEKMHNWWAGNKFLSKKDKEGDV